MAKAYWVVTYRAIKDPDKLAAYAKLAGPAIQSLGGKFLVRGTPAKTFEGGLNQRTVVSEWPEPRRKRSPPTTARRTRKRCARWATASSATSGSSRVLSSFPERVRIDDVDRLAGGVGDDLVEDVRELELVLLARDVAEVRRADDVVHGEQRMLRRRSPALPRRRPPRPCPGRPA